MYVPPAFAQPDIAELHQVIRRHPFATLVTMTGEGLDANHIPFVIDGGPAPYGTLRGHVSRANAIWSATRADVEALVIFRGPDAFVSPSWYPTKQQTGRVVPTWNYVVVHAHGRVRFVDDPAWLREHVTALTDAHESTRMPRWRIDDAPPEYIEAQLRAIVGVEIPIARLVGKWKLSQNRQPQDRDGVVRALTQEDAASARAVGELMRRGD
jgi:transcriptional regulator